VSSDLSGIKAKLDRAEFHCKAINSAAKEYTEVYLPNTVRERLTRFPLYSLNKDWQPILWDNVIPPGPQWGVILGEFVHDTRSALDQLIWALVLANNGNPGTHTQFPAAESKAKWRDDVTERDITERGLPPSHGLSDDALALVYDFQPFNRMPRRKAVSAPFYKLLRLSNEDKHRTLHLAAAYTTAAPVSLRITPPGYIGFVKIRRPKPGIVIQNGAEIASVKIAIIKQPPPGVQMKVSFTLHAHVAFFADDRHIADLSDLIPMVEDAREILGRARRLPEISA
jgi:hypothetical protein